MKLVSMIGMHLVTVAAPTGSIPDANDESNIEGCTLYVLQAGSDPTTPDVEFRIEGRCGYYHHGRLRGGSIFRCGKLLLT